MPVTDQDKAKAFYTEALGFRTLLEMPVPMGENSRWIEVAPEGADTTLILANWLEMTPGSVVGLMLESTDIDTDVEALRAAGVAVEGPVDLPFGRQATFSDPDGNGFVLAQRADGQG
ncbi:MULTISPECIES: VOC family protein [Micromonospora]|uniref:VOC family protein n=1 Tax=Micromonospora TaxID=1873 RepID=UPI001C31C298|nr:VOC family protein [Micromonospora yangpuensis]